MQVAVPSREQVEQYRILRDDIDRLVGRINGDLGRIGRPAISYLHSSYPREEMAALYRAADIMVVTPYRDGMNLVAKEYVACRTEDDGALVLSEFAGAADELRQAWLVNPYDINGMKSALLEAYDAGDKELTRRMKAMRKTIQQARRRRLGRLLHGRARPPSRTAPTPRPSGPPSARRSDPAGPTRPHRDGGRAEPPPPSPWRSRRTAPGGRARPPAAVSRPHGRQRGYGDVARVAARSVVRGRGTARLNQGPPSDARWPAWLRGRLAAASEPLPRGRGA